MPFCSYLHLETWFLHDLLSDSSSFNMIFLISFRGFKDNAANLCGVGTVQLVIIPHVTWYNDSQIFLHCEYPQIICQSDSTHILPHLLRSGPCCEYFTCESAGQFIYFSYSEHFRSPPLLGSLGGVTVARTGPPILHDSQILLCRIHILSLYLPTIYWFGSRTLADLL